jgi:hypothetical protein
MIGIMVVNPPLVAMPTKTAQTTEMATIRRYGNTYRVERQNSDNRLSLTFPPGASADRATDG